jgi:hypothetical protein
MGPLADLRPSPGKENKVRLHWIDHCEDKKEVL